MGDFLTTSVLGQHAGEDFEPQVLFVAQSMGAALDDADLIVDALDEAERYIVLGLARSKE